MNALTVISTDLLTPLGAYLRLREGGRGSFLLESVEKGRLGRHSFVGFGSEFVDFEGAEASGLPVVGYLGYDHAATLMGAVSLMFRGRTETSSPPRSPTTTIAPLRSSQLVASDIDGGCMHTASTSLKWPRSHV